MFKPRWPRCAARHGPGKGRGFWPKDPRLLGEARRGLRPNGGAAGSGAARRRRGAGTKLKSRRGRPAGAMGDRAGEAGGAAGTAGPSLLDHYRHYQDRLIRLNRGNRSVLLRRTSARTSIDLHALEGVRAGTLERVAAACARGGGAAIQVLPDRADGHGPLRASLTALDRRLRHLEEETGQQIGYVGFPFLEGRVGGGEVRGPLVLFAASLERRRERAAGWYLKVHEQAPVLNVALLKAVERLSGRRLARAEDGLEDTLERLGDGGPGPAGAFGALASWIEGQLELDGGGRVSEPSEIGQLSRADTDAGLWPLRVANRMALGIFPQADVNMFGDYEELMSRAGGGEGGGVAADLIGLAGEGGDGDGDGDGAARIDMDRVSAGELNTVLPSDASQSEAIVASKRVPLVAVRGPPGTGKSQMIVNMVADAISRGEKVLVVCQKRAALDVVHRRLEDVGLGEYAVLMTRESDDRRAVYARMAESLDRAVEAAASGGGAGAGSGLPGVTGEIDEATARLKELEAALGARHAGGAALHDLYCMARPGYRTLGIAAIDALEATQAELGEHAAWVGARMAGCLRYDVGTFALHGRRGLARASQADRARLEAALGALAGAADDAIVCASKAEQEELLGVLASWGGGMLWRVRRGGAARRARGLIGRALDEGDVAGEARRARDGMSWWGSLGVVREFFADDAAASLAGAAGEEGHGRARWAAMAEALGEFDRIQEHDAARAAAPAGLNAVLDGLLGSGEREADWGEVLRQEAYLRWIGEVEAEHPVLRGTPMERYNEHRRRLADAMGRQKDSVRAKIRELVLGSVGMPKKYARNRTAGEESWREFSREIRKRRHAKPVRVLFERHGEKFLGIAPCWLMSPEAACKMLPLRRGAVDAVIMDEASQLAVERALPVLYRARRAVIAGDDKQLQPFDLFEVREEDADGELPEERSLLDMAYARLPQWPLSWHYRSRYQELIDFSNHAFYSGGLNVSPNRVIRPRLPPIQWIRCNGTWAARKNAVEATEAVEQVRRVWKEAAGGLPSVAVITFNDEQQNLIMDVIDSLRDGDAEFEALYSRMEAMPASDRLIVKNIENVQGDERDVVVFSVGYAKGTDGKFSNFFGTLSARGGENRLNVAITRARHAMVVVSSIDPAEIKPTSANEGPRLLRKFLEYAKATGERDAEAQRAVLDSLEAASTKRRQGAAQEFESRFEEMVARALEGGHGYEVHTQVGVSGYRIDLAIVDPDDAGAYILGVECDGAMFHSARSVRERDVLRQEFLESKGWEIERVWSRDWWRNPEREIARIAARVDGLRAGGAPRKEAGGGGRAGEAGKGGGPPHRGD